LDLPVAFGPPPAAGRTRVNPEDFQVEELLGFEPDGAGAHLLLVVEKRGANTGWVASQLARVAGVHPRDVGFSGLKDRHAVTRQSYSLPWGAAAPPDACLGWSGEGFRVLAASRHGRKLRPGSHRGNHFVVRVRDFAGDVAAVDERIRLVATAGVPNYFGPQRFGRAGANLARARDWAAGAVAPRERSQRSFLLSAARSALFNEVLAERVRRGDWNALLPGEAVMLDGRRSYFRATELDETLGARCAQMDVHPSGPLWGAGESPASGAAWAVEERALAQEAALCALLAAQGLEQERRSLRLPVRALAWRTGNDGLTLEFELPRGAFATAVLHELLAGAWDAAGTVEE
jgi:tRNA pseudouridine13 synthase